MTARKSCGKIGASKPKGRLVPVFHEVRIRDTTLKARPLNWWRRVVLFRRWPYTVGKRVEFEIQIISHGASTQIDLENISIRVELPQQIIRRLIRGRATTVLEHSGVIIVRDGPITRSGEMSYWLCRFERYQGTLVTFEAVTQESITMKAAVILLPTVGAVIGALVTWLLGC